MFTEGFNSQFIDISWTFDKINSSDLIGISCFSLKYSVVSFLNWKIAVHPNILNWMFLKSKEIKPRKDYIRNLSFVERIKESEKNYYLLLNPQKIKMVTCFSSSPQFFFSDTFVGDCALLSGGGNDDWDEKNSTLFSRLDSRGKTKTQKWKVNKKQLWKHFVFFKRSRQINTPKINISFMNILLGPNIIPRVCECSCFSFSEPVWNACVARLSLFFFLLVFDIWQYVSGIRFGCSLLKLKGNFIRTERFVNRQHTHSLTNKVKKNGE